MIHNTIEDTIIVWKRVRNSINIINVFMYQMVSDVTAILTIYNKYLVMIKATSKMKMAWMLDLSEKMD